MLAYLARRLLHMIPLLLGITFLSFAVIDLAPGDYFSALKMNPTISPEAIHQMELQFGYGEPLPLRYGKWLWRVLHLDLGISVAYRVNVVDLIGARALNTVILATASMLMTWSLAIPIGIIVALRPNSITDRLLSFLAFFGMSLPNFFLAFLLMFMALRTGWFPIGGSFSVSYDSLPFWGRVMDRLHHLWLPMTVLGVAGMASLMRLMRANILEIKQADFVRTARAKGLSERAVVGKHILRNALNPFITLAGYELGNLLGGAALVEAVMNLQGLGTLMLDAVRSLDVYLVMGSVLMGSVLLLTGNLLADLVLTWVDPRIDFTRLESAR
ncbi:MAG: oligopeptide transport system permease protein AppB [Deltaproteobacteria bacterium]|nr:oligopeptide transport system permease protein AppB [Deltaproteobacteria bacterium]